jgi:zinc transport system permease protein
LIVLTAIVVAVGMRVVGVLLVGALMVIPVITATRIAKSFLQTVVWAVVFAEISVIMGLVAAFYLGLIAALAIFGVTQLKKI